MQWVCLHEIQQCHPGEPKILCGNKLWSGNICLAPWLLVKRPSWTRKMQQIIPWIGFYKGPSLSEECCNHLMGVRLAFWLWHTPFKCLGNSVPKWKQDLLHGEAYHWDLHCRARGVQLLGIVTGWILVRWRTVSRASPWCWRLYHGDSLQAAWMPWSDQSITQTNCHIPYIPTRWKSGWHGNHLCSQSCNGQGISPIANDDTVMQCTQESMWH